MRDFVSGIPVPGRLWGVQWQSPSWARVDDHLRCLTRSSLSLPVPTPVRSPAVKKGRHRRFEEARKLKQAGPSAFDLGLGGSDKGPKSQDDEYAALAEKYGVVFDDDDEDLDDLEATDTDESDDADDE